MQNPRWGPRIVYDFNDKKLLMAIGEFGTNSLKKAYLN